MTGLPNFTVSRFDRDIIVKIADRALAFGRSNGIRMKLMDVQMDITATHANGNPLRLEALLDADDFNFAHDILGIREHLDRNTGRLLHCFRPRFSQPVEARADG